jgi:serine/threonine protein kinase
MSRLAWLHGLSSLAFALRTEPFDAPIWKTDIRWEDRINEFDPAITILEDLSDGEGDVLLIEMDGEERILKLLIHSKKEYVSLLRANQKGINFTPRLYEVGADYFIQEKVDGIGLDMYLMDLITGFDLTGSLLSPSAYDVAVKVIYLAASGIVDLESIGVYHCDPHAGNFIITQNNNVAVIDFDQSNVPDEEVYITSQGTCELMNAAKMKQIIEEFLEALDSYILHAGYEVEYGTAVSANDMTRMKDYERQLKRAMKKDLRGQLEILEDLVKEHNL